MSAIIVKYAKPMNVYYVTAKFGSLTLVCRASGYSIEDAVETFCAAEDVFSNGRYEVLAVSATHPRDKVADVAINDTGDIDLF